MTNAQDKVRAELVEQLALIGGKVVGDDDIARHGDTLVVPERMSLLEASTFLAEKVKDEARLEGQSRVFKYRPWDGAHAFQAAIKRYFGALRTVGTPGFFGENPPEMITINTGPDSTTQVPWGGLQIPGLPDVTFYADDMFDADLGPVFFLHTHGPKRDRAAILGVFELVEQELRTNSIYRGKAFDGEAMPNFLDLSGIDPSDVVYTQEMMRQLDANLWSPIAYAQAHRALNLPLKRSVLLEGPYGTGKTLAAFLTAQRCLLNGWTFLYCRPGKDDIATVMQTARLYQPAVVFFEDVDTISKPGQPDQVSKLLDVFDGIQAKGTEIMVVLTTNHAELIHKGMVRPGRLDAVIHVGAMDQAGVERLVRRVCRGMLDDHIDFDAVFAANDGYMPAFVKEGVERAVRYALARCQGEPVAIRINTDDLVAAAAGLRDQLDLMEGNKEHHEVDALGAALENHLKNVTAKTSLVKNRNGNAKMGELKVDA